MEHKKAYFKKKLDTKKGTFIIEGPVSANRLSQYDLHEGLVTFRPANEQKEALINIANKEEGRIIIAREGNVIVGYVTFHYPDPIERWSEGQIENLLELGGIEVAPPYRGLSIGKQLLNVAMKDDAMEDYIIFATEYYWHWDLKGTGLSVWEYRKIMEKMMKVIGFTSVTTDDPDICSHPANCLMVRIGKRAGKESVDKFNSLRFKKRYIFER